MATPDDLDPPDNDPLEGNGAARVPLSETINAVLDVLDDCAVGLSAVRYRLRQQEMPEHLDIDESELPRLDEQPGTSTLGENQSNEG